MWTLRLTKSSLQDEGGKDSGGKKVFEQRHRKHWHCATFWIVSTFKCL